MAKMITFNITRSSLFRGFFEKRNSFNYCIDNHFGRFFGEVNSKRVFLKVGLKRTMPSFHEKRFVNFFCFVYYSWVKFPILNRIYMVLNINIEVSRAENPPKRLDGG